MKNKKGIAPFIVIGSFLLVILAVYLFMFLPFPALKPIKANVDYFIILSLWVILQIAFIYFYFKLATWSITLFKFYKEYVFGLSLKIKDFIQVHT